MSARLERAAAQGRSPRGCMHWIIATGLLGGALGLTIVAPPAPRLVWNASASVPIGLYWVRPRARLARGAMVLARTPATWRRLAAERRYLPQNVPLVKRIGALPGDRVCARGTAISVAGRVVASRLRVDAQGRHLPWWEGCAVLGKGQLLLLIPDVPGSFDGRYFGPTDRLDVIGRASPIWTR